MSIHGVYPPPDYIHLVGTVSLLIATKIHEPSSLSTNVVEQQILRGKYKEEEIIKMEEIICKSLNFEFGHPTEYTCIGMYMELMHKGTETREIYEQVLKNAHSYRLA